MAVNECITKTKRREVLDLYPYCTEVLELGAQNRLAIEYNDGSQIRIDGICTTDRAALYQMLDALVAEAHNRGCHRIVYADMLADDVVAMLVEYGFEETPVMGSCDPNRYLCLQTETSDKSQ